MVSILSLYLGGEKRNQLEFKSLTAKNDGVYKCEVSNAFGTQSKTFKLSVKDPAKVITVEEETNDYEDNETFDETLTVSCVVKGHPMPEVSWSTSKSELFSTKKMNLEKHFARSSGMEIFTNAQGRPVNQFQVGKGEYYFHLMQTDEGYLRINFVFNNRKSIDLNELFCKAKNIHGEDENSIKLEGSGAKEFIRFDDNGGSEVHRNVKLNTNLDLKCNIEGFPKPSIRWTFVSFHSEFKKIY